MTQEQKRIAIAQACGWTGFNPDNIPDCLQYTARSPSGKWGLIPDYLNDLNAMHEAEKLLYRNHWFLYESNLDLVAPFRSTRATAAERADAFLETIGE